MGHIWSMSAPLSIWQKKWHAWHGGIYIHENKMQFEGQPYKKKDQITVGLFLHRYIYIYKYVDLPRGAEWMIRGYKGCRKTPSLRVQTAPFGRCWYIYI